MLNSMMVDLIFVVCCVQMECGARSRRVGEMEWYGIELVNNICRLLDSAAKLSWCKMPKQRSWNDYLTSQLIATGDVNQACLLGITDCNVWASANEFLPRMHKSQIMQDDGTEKETEINEATIMLHTATELKKPAEGFWINGVKYMPLRTYPQGSANDGIGTIYFKKPKKGGCFCVLNTCILIGTYDEAKQQTAASCNFAVEQLARYLHSNGF